MWLDAGGTPPMVLRPLTDTDVEPLLRIHRAPEVVEWWDEPAERFPWDEPESVRFVIEVDGEVVGLIQYSEELEPKYRHASVDLFVDPTQRGHGYGPRALSRVVRHLIDERGHHRVTIDPAVGNAAAVRAYEKVGFQPVGVMRCAERDADGNGWHDALLMDLLAGEERDAL